MKVMKEKNRRHRMKTKIAALMDLANLKNLTSLMNLNSNLNLNWMNLNWMNLMNLKSLRHSGNSDRTLQVPCWSQSSVPLGEVPSS